MPITAALLLFLAVPLQAASKTLAACLANGHCSSKAMVRSGVGQKTLGDLGVPKLKAFAKDLKNEKIKWPVYRISKDVQVRDFQERKLEIQARLSTFGRNRLMRASTSWRKWRAQRESGRLLQQRKPLSKLDGIPFIVNDELSASGFTELVGTNPRDQRNPRRGRPAVENDPVIQALLDAGAILFGTSVLHEYGISPVGYNAGHQGPLNAFDQTRFTGGSSGGSATGVALGLFPFAIGFDGDGSVRIPASWSGVVGAIPTFGAVRYDNAETEIFTTLHCGPIAANVADAAIVMSVMANTKNQGDHFCDKVYRDRFGVPMPEINFAPLHDKDPTFTIGYDTAWVHDSDPEIETMFYEDRDWIQQQPGWSIHDNFMTTHWKEQALAHTLIIVSEFHRNYKNDKIEMLEPNTKFFLALGSEIDKEMIDAAERVKKWASEQWMQQFEHMDAVITPAMAVPAQHIEDGIDENGLFDATLVSTMLKYRWPSNLMGFPSVTATVRNNKDELPIGIQVICRPFEDGKCLALAKKIEEHFEGRREHPEQWGGDLEKSDSWAWLDVIQQARAR
ncbi:hypothetical protein FOZ62_024185 [Perkinsus olseni]|uniref:Amidase domain-containing protein n=1 Tax=Perkinsus olseni TaxID=32597 RepID=A0A7J6PVF1_PEROL|nr:hypothetical protein FOZ62_024185 [Perkinsus olseni]